MVRQFLAYKAVSSVKAIWGKEVSGAKIVSSVKAFWDKTVSGVKAV